MARSKISPYPLFMGFESNEYGTGVGTGSIIINALGVEIPQLLTVSVQEAVTTTSAGELITTGEQALDVSLQEELDIELEGC